MQDYVYNFFVWWYAIKLKSLIIKLRGFEYLLLSSTNTLDMLHNLGKPLYQDYSLVGRVIGFVIRLVWALGGITLFGLVLIPIVMIIVLFAALPILVVVQISLALIITVAGGI